eukprot:10774923-Heterocapsa_arctica.AAC.1
MSRVVSRPKPSSEYSRKGQRKDICNALRERTARRRTDRHLQCVRERTARRSTEDIYNASRAHTAPRGAGRHL